MAEYAQVAATRGLSPTSFPYGISPRKRCGTQRKWATHRSGGTAPYTPTGPACHMARGTNGDRAGYGVVYLKSDGTVAASGHGVVPLHLPQTAAAAEAYAVQVALRLTLGSVSVATDSAAAVSNCADLKSAAEKDTTLSGVYRSIRGDGGIHRLQGGRTPEAG